jgi:transcriptional regulator with XRE-family HTH domain
MNSIQIGKIIAASRKEKGITQEELANHLGVSKPAVSKWESGQSYPDILLLPELASYFNITVDRLLGYEPQMAKEDVRKLYHRLADDFAREPFEKVYEECEGYIKKYFSCWYLQNQMALLLVNHCSLAGDTELIMKILERALELFIRVEKSSDDVALAKLALQMEAFCYLTLQRPVEAIDILEKLNEQLMTTESLLVRAYQMKGDLKKAIEHLQGYTVVNLMAIIDAASDYFQMYADQPERMQEYYRLYLQLCEVFEVEQLYPAALIKIYFAAAMVYISQGNKEACMDSLEQYAGLVNRLDKDSFKLPGSRIFDALEGYYSSVDIETTAPRSAKVIWKDIIDGVLHNPAFEPLEQEERFKKIKAELGRQI